MEQGQRCGNCECFLKDPKQINSGTCHLSPPVPVLLLIQEGIGPMSPIKSGAKWMFPHVHSNSLGCSHYRRGIDNEVEEGA